MGFWKKSINVGITNVTTYYSFGLEITLSLVQVNTNCNSGVDATLQFNYPRNQGNNIVCVVLLSYSGDHTETVQLEYDPNRTTYSDLLTRFWKDHDPTALHKAQYMSAIFFHDEEQKKLAEQTRNEHQKTLRRPIVTKILPAKRFYDAEEYAK